MSYRFFPTAKIRLNQIWDYSEEQWGEEQAELYIRGLFGKLETAVSQRYEWKPVRHERFKGVYFIPYRHHFIFFKELGSGELGVISILHESMDIPRRLREDN